MIINGPLPVNPARPVGEVLNLRLNQMVTAEIMRVSGIQAELVIDGIPIIAHLENSDQAATLQSQRTARFLVKDLTDQAVTLRLLKPTETTLAPLPYAGRDLAALLLKQFDLSATPENVQLAKAMLRYGMEFSPDLLSELRGILDQLGQWGQNEAELAAALKAAGLPVTPGSLALISHSGSNTPQAMLQLLFGLRSLIKDGNLSPISTELLQRMLKQLEQAIPGWNEPPAHLAEQLRQAATFMGQALEHVLAQQVKNPGTALGSKGMVLLADLRRFLDAAGQPGMAKQAELLMHELSSNQFMNITPDPVPGQGFWSRLNLVLQVPPSPEFPKEKYYPAHLQIAHRQDTENKAIDPDYTRLVVQIDLDNDESIQVDLSIVKKQIRADITTPNPTVNDLAQSEFPSLEDGLSQAGFTVQSCKVEVNQPLDLNGLPAAHGDHLHWQAVDVQV